MTVLGQFLATLQARRRRQGAVPPPAALGAWRPLLALPAPPGAQLGPRCPHCHHRHPVDRGLALTYGSPIDRLGDGRPRPLRDDAPDPIARPNPWRY